jgi:hypothetical protein
MNEHNHGLIGGDFAEGAETLPRNEHVASFAEGEETLPHEHLATFAEGEETLPPDDRIGTFGDREDAESR